MIVALGLPGLAAAGTAGGPSTGELGPIPLWNLIIGIFLADEAATPPPNATGGDADQNGGAMDPNGNPKPVPPPPPPPPPPNP